MSALIGSAIGSDERLVLRTNQAARVLSIGTNWTTLRVGARITFDDFGFTVQGNPRFFMGVMSNPASGASGLTNGPLNYVTSHFVGNVDTTQDWSRTAGPVKYTAASNLPAKGKKVGSAITGIATAAGQRMISGTTTLRTVQIVEIVKGSPNFTIRLLMNNSTSTPADTTITHLKTAMVQASMAAAVTYLDGQGIGDYTLVSSPDNTLAVNEATDGFLNAVCIGWDRDFPACYVSELLFAKLA